jgi:hypothetical protein
LVELECPPIAFDLPRLSCCCGFFPGPPELSAINPDAVHNHGQASSTSASCWDRTKDITMTGARTYR